MEDANRLSRKAAELEGEQRWTEAADMHRLAASSYNNIRSFDYDPVATLTLASLVNKHQRWAEHCEQKSEQLANAQSTVAQHGPDNHEKLPAEVPSQHNDSDMLKRGQSSDDEHEFEDFWQYMQRWLANPAAFTRPTLPSGSRDAGVGSDPGGHGPGPSIMESFYLVGSNPEQSASVYGAGASMPRTVTPKAAAAGTLQVLNEVDEPDEGAAASIPSVLAATSAGVSADTPSSEPNKDSMLERLMAENEELRRQLRRQSERVRTLESAAQENNMLKSSILSFREEFHRHANVVALPRILEQSSSPRRVQTPPTDVAVTDSHIQQLESQLQLLQLENSKQKTQVAKYRDRWERLKESAKRKCQQLESQQQ
ncbi:hypothetical protein GGF42_005370 [Coemansia sp. RSA 2424]|nr:hypothetical protein GGF42_005370 [Coemansia sp. RSA 2424]